MNDNLSQQTLQDSFVMLEQFKCALDQHAIVATTDIQGNITSVNENFCSISQYSREELLGQNHRILSSDYHSRAFYREMWECLKSGRVWHGEIKNRKKSGESYWVNVTIMPFFSDAGNSGQFISISTDITERRVSEDALRDSETKYRSLFENAKGGFLLLDLTGTLYTDENGLKRCDLTMLGQRCYLDCNKEAARMYGLSRKEMLSRPVKDSSPDTQPNGESTYESIETTILRALDGDTLNFEWKALRHDGTLFDTDVTVNVVEIAGRLYLQSLLVDITARKLAEKSLIESENKYRRLFEFSNDGNYLLELTGCIKVNEHGEDVVDLSVLEGRGYHDCNEQGAKMYGLTREEMLSRSLEGFMPERQSDGRLSAEVAEEFILAAIKGDSVKLEWTSLRADGEPFRIEASASVVIIDGRIFLLSVTRDITERKRAEMAIRESELRYRTLFEHAHDGVLLLDLTDSIVYDSHGKQSLNLSVLEGRSYLDCNQEAARMYGRTREEMTMLPIRGNMPERQPDGKLSSVAATEDVLAAINGETRNFQWVALRSDGSPFDIEVSISKVEINGKTYLQSIVRDISILKAAEEAKRAEQEMRNKLIKQAELDDIKTRFVSELKKVNEELQKRVDERTREYSEKNQLLQVVLDAIPSNVFWKDKDLRYLGCNREFAEGAGFSSPDEMIGLTDYDLPWADLAEHYRADDLAVIQSEQPKLYIEETLRLSDGSVIDLSTSKVPLRDAEGNVFAVLGAFNDITQRKAAEAEIQLLHHDLERRIIVRTAELVESNERIRKLIESANDAVVSIDADSNVIDWNGQAERMFGWSREEAMGKQIQSMIVPPKFRGLHGRELKRYLDTGKSKLINNSTEFTARHRDGHEFDIELSVWQVPTGQQFTFSAFIRDISERKRAEHEIRNALIKETELGEMKSRFVSRTSHEFRTPLSSIMTSAKILESYQERLPKDEVDYLFNSIHSAVTNMTSLLDAVLDTGRVDAERQQFQPMPMDLELFCSQLVNEFRMTAPVGIKIAFDSNVQNRKEFMLDGKLLRHILGNLISNAIKYSPQGGEVFFGVELIDADIHFKVVDQGIGIPKEDIPRLFESYYRAGNVGQISGTGLGLNIARASTELHGGNINLDSNLGEGTTFHVIIPT